MRFLFLFLLRILSFKVSALKKLKTQKKTPSKTHHVTAGLRSGQPRATGFQHGLKKLFSNILYQVAKADNQKIVGLS